MDLPDNLAVFTTDFVVRKKVPIVLVSHDADGAWQFLSAEGASMEHLMLVSLGTILEIDPSVKNVLSIPEGSEAHRADTSGEWVVVSGN